MFPFEKKKKKRKKGELTELRRFFHISAEKLQKINHTRKSYEKGLPIMRTSSLRALETNPSMESYFFIKMFTTYNHKDRSKAR